MIVEQSHDWISAPNSVTRYYLEIFIQGHKIRALIDSGSTKTYVGKIFKKFLHGSLRSSNATVSVATGQTVPVEGESDLLVKIDEQEKVLPVRLVSSFVYDCVLGIDFLKLFGFEIDFGHHCWRLPRMSDYIKFELDDDFEYLEQCDGLSELTDEQRQIVDKLVKENIKPPGDILSVANITKHTIDVQGHPPIAQPLRRYSPKIYEAAHEAVDKLLRSGVIEPSNSPWCSPPVLALKKDETYRFCVDFRKINAVTRKDIHPIPNIDSILDRLRKARYITKIDMTKAFHQIEIEEEHRDITAFAIFGRGQFRYRRMPFGLCNSPRTYQKAMDKFIREHLPLEPRPSYLYISTI